MRNVGLLLASLFVILLGVSTIAEISVNGVDPIGVVAVLITGLFAVGLIGAFRNSAD